MKTALVAILTAAVLGLLAFLLGHPLVIVDYVIILFIMSIITWTFEQYKERKLQ